MQVSATAGGVLETDVLVVGVFQGELGPSARALDEQLGGVLSELLASEEIRGSLGEVTKLLRHPQAPAPLVVAVGFGERARLQGAGARRAAAAASMAIAPRPRKSVAFRLDLEPSLSAAALIGAMTGCAGCDLHRAEKKLHPFEQLHWDGLDAESLQQASVIGEGVNLTRQLVNQPANVIDPEQFAEVARGIAAAGGLECEIWDRGRLEQERCGSLLAVARGSAKEPRLVILRHAGAAADAPWLGLVGKGVTFDSGGLSLKPSDSMKTMKCDMAGAATVLGAMQAISALKLPCNVLAVCGLVENMVGPDSYRLGDVLTARNGRTIEVLNTDAEGRLVLADALDVAVERGASRLVDLATLTGACVVALGHEAAGLMTNDEAWCAEVKAAASTSGERMWELPMYDDYGEQIRSEVADIKNVGAGRWAGAITAAKFLQEFVDDVPWTHIDIAGPAFLEGKPGQINGGTGAGVATLVELARRAVR
ncbi:MAG: leucyl aminopeptidase [Planctomycetales bacterium]|nr:leucyl aminopeptidase [Planctomycetales bacterium]